MTPRQSPDANLLTFHIENTSGLSPYLQLVQQITHALRLGRLKMGDRLPTVRDVASQVAINPNTVLKAYRHLEVQGLLVSRPGRGVFVARELAGPSAWPSPAPAPSDVLASCRVAMRGNICRKSDMRHRTLPCFAAFRSATSSRWAHDSTHAGMRPWRQPVYDGWASASNIRWRRSPAACGLRWHWSSPSPSCPNCCFWMSRWHRLIPLPDTSSCSS